MMMQLTTIKKWVNPNCISLAKEILDRWGYDADSVDFFRVSANVVFEFLRDGQRYFLRINDSCERELKAIEAEIHILRYLADKSLPVAQPLISRNGYYVEVVEKEESTLYAVVFEGLVGQQFDFAELNQEQIFAWGRAMGQLHTAFQNMPAEYSANRPAWQNHLDFVKANVGDDPTVLLELEKVTKRMQSLPVTPENFGLIHYDLESDNLYWLDGAFSALDFDDSAHYWYVADMAYALRDLFKEKVDIEHPLFKVFLEGYCTEVAVDERLLPELPWFMRLHNLVTYAKLLRSVRGFEIRDSPNWLLELQDRLQTIIERYRGFFANFAQEK